MLKASPAIEVQEFEQVQATPETALLRVRALAREGFSPADTHLVLDGGRHRLVALPGPPDPAGLLRAAYPVPTDLLARARRYALALPDGSLHRLPTPSRRRPAGPRRPAAPPPAGPRGRQASSAYETDRRAEARRLALIELERRLTRGLSDARQPLAGARAQTEQHAATVREYSREHRTPQGRLAQTEDRLTAVHEQLSNAQDRRNRAQSALADVEIQARQADLEVLSRTAEAAFLAEALEHARRHGAELQKEAGSLRQQLAERRQLVIEATERARMYEAKHQEELEELRNQLARASRSEHAASLHLGRMGEEAMARAAESTILREAIAEHRRQLASATSELDTIRRKATLAQARSIENMRRQRAEADARAAQLAAQTDATIRRRSEELARVHEQRSATEAQLLDQADRRAAAYAANLAMMQRAIADGRKRLADAQRSDQIALERQRSERAALEAGHAARIARLQGRIDQCLEELRHAHEQRRWLDTELRRAQAAARARAEAEAHATRLATQLEAAEVNLAAIAEVVRSETVRRELLQQQVTALRAENEQLTARVADLLSQAEVREPGQADGEAVSRELELDEARGLLRERTDQVADLSAGAQRHASRIASLQARLVELTAGRDEARAGQAEALVGIEALRARAAALERRLITRRRDEAHAVQRVLADLAATAAARLDAERLAAVLAQDLAVYQERQGRAARTSGAAWPRAAQASGSPPADAELALLEHATSAAARLLARNEVEALLRRQAPRHAPRQVSRSRGRPATSD